MTVTSHARFSLVFAAFTTALVLSAMTNSTNAFAQESNSGKFAIVLHGGAGGDPTKWSESYRATKKQSLGAALDQGVAVLRAGRSALEAVEAVVRVLEDDPLFNAGRGCVLNEAGDHELDASIMDGKNLACGAVAGVKRAKNPITLARHVMTDTRHVLLGSAGADQFAESIGLELVEPSYFKTESQIEAWKRWKTMQSSRAELYPGQYSPEGKEIKYYGTVGCVAVDSQGNIAAATSTGGLMGKRWGRVGDTPVIGAGTYANNLTCGVSCTGTGEEFIRHNVAADVSARMKYGSQSLKEAVDHVITKVLPEDCGGLIAIDKSYNIVMQYNTAVMARAAADSNGRRDILLELNN